MIPAAGGREAGKGADVAKDVAKDVGGGEGGVAEADARAGAERGPSPLAAPAGLGGRGVGVVLGSAFDDRIPRSLEMREVTLETPFGPQPLYLGRTRRGTPAVVLFRHGFPHTHLPHEVNFRAQAWALARAGCGAVVLNSSVGVLDPGVPVGTPLLATDLLMPENRLPDGALCTLFTPEAVARDPELAARRGHLVLSEGIFSRPLGAQLEGLDTRLHGDRGTLGGGPDPLVFVYAPGPRTKTPAENRFWAALGGQVNSMSVGPEAVLLGELGIPCAALVVGHKRSGGEGPAPDRQALASSLDQARDAAEALLTAFLLEGEPVTSGNHLFPFDAPPLPSRAFNPRATRPAAAGQEGEDHEGSEEVTVLARGPGLRIERIVSRGHASPPGFWYDQEEAEWVTLLTGRARLRLLDPDETRELSPGDHLHLAPHRRHRVEWTAPDEPTVWLAVFHPG